ncbi:peptide chain release factor 2 [Acidiferrimicrobium sp. IK]|uniref:peptide chain release factor 2 n=1 Tax=Acidiferrimicrobium sp. IK TaxID=2871700 RepID=UPI0021CB4FAC|nr:peptide chain release factor 2 [Acidiferrimicrobium sp. IK]MCU4185679.1 peptide chain release factor 2 [Acidiferrimicrobium sp. IK]
MRDFTEDIRALRRRLSEAETYLDLDGSRRRLAELEEEMGRPDLWDNTDLGQKVTREYGQVKGDVDVLEALDAGIGDIETLFQLAEEEGDDSVAGELEDQSAAAARTLDELELRSLFTGEHDERDAVCEIHAKDGGTDAQDWAEMLLRMYQRWAERRGFEMEIDEVSEGQEAGILSATFIVKGRFAFGLLGSERGVHRLVRISPFDSQSRRQTSFASVSAVPFFEDLSGEVDIDEKELRIDTYRSSGAGGQHVNVTDSAVRITHLPTGVVVAVQNERSQHQNKAKAMQILAAKLAERQREERAAQLDAMAGPKAQVGWGAQIRSYVLAPYQQVKDLRTDYETGNVQAVLDGDLDAFMEAWLRWRRAGAGA